MLSLHDLSRHQKFLMNILAVLHLRGCQNIIPFSTLSTQPSRVLFHTSQRSFLAEIDVEYPLVQYWYYCHDESTASPKVMVLRIKNYHLFEGYLSWASNYGFSF